VNVGHVDLLAGSLEARRSAFWREQDDNAQPGRLLRPCRRMSVAGVRCRRSTAERKA